MTILFSASTAPGRRWGRKRIFHLEVEAWSSYPGYVVTFYWNLLVHLKENFILSTNIQFILVLLWNQLIFILSSLRRNHRVGIAALLLFSFKRFHNIIKDLHFVVALSKYHLEGSFFNFKSFTDDWKGLMSSKLSLNSLINVSHLCGFSSFICVSFSDMLYISLLTFKI